MVIMTTMVGDLVVLKVYEMQMRENGSKDKMIRRMFWFDSER